MILVDTSVWISIFRDKNGSYTTAFKRRIGSATYALSRFNQLEILQGAKNDEEWQTLNDYLDTQIYIEASPPTWRQAAKIYYDLRRRGLTINSPIDCCIAQIAIENNVLLLHRDHDFEQIAKHRNLTQEFLHPHNG